MKFLQWLKFFSLSFFTLKHSREAAVRRALNALLSAVLSLVLLFCGLLLGYSTSFGTHYRTANEFREFLYATFAEPSDERIDFSATDGVPDVSIPDRETVNSYVDGAYRKNDYELIIDLRPADSTFARFTAYYKDKNGGELTEAEYAALSDEDKGNYTFDIKCDGERLDPAASHSEYVAYLDGVSTEGADGYNESVASKYAELKEKKDAGEIAGDKYVDDIYCLYVSARYPSLAQDAYGGAPTLKSYYLRLVGADMGSRYLMMLADRCVCAFVNDKGVAMLVDGNYGKANISIDSSTDEAAARAALDGFVSSVFSSAGSIDAGLYFINLMTVLPFLLIAYAVVVIVLLLADKLGHCENINGFLGATKIVGSFLFVSGFVAFIAAIIFSRLFSRGTAYMYTLYVFVAVFALRTIVQAIIEIVAARKNKQSSQDDEESDEQIAADETEQPQEQ